MTPDGNLDLSKEIKNTRNSKYVGTYYRFLHFLILFKRKRQFKAKIVTRYYRVYNIHRRKIYDGNKTKDGSQKVLTLLT